MNRRTEWSWGRLAFQLVVLALVCLVVNYPAHAQEALAFVGLNFVIEPVIFAGIALGIAALPDAEFQTKVLEKIDPIAKAMEDHKKAVEEVNTKVSNWDKETKKTAEEFTALKKVANDQQANFDAFVLKMGEFQKALRREASAIVGDPIARIMADDELRTRLNCAVRLACDKNGDMAAVCAPQMKALGETWDGLCEKHAARLQLQTKAGLGEDTSPGSLMINDALSKEIYSTLPNYGIWPTLAVEPVGTKNTKFFVDTADPVAVVVLTEGDDIPDDANIAGTQVTATAEVIAVLINISLQLLEDAEFDVSGNTMRKFARAWAKRLDHLAFAADGTADAVHGGMTGLFNFGTAAGAGLGNASAESLDLDDFIRCLVTVDAEVLNNSPKWWVHPQILARFISIRDENGRPIFLTAIEAPTKQGIGSILGYPTIPGNICPSTNGASAKLAAFGDSGSVVVGMRRTYSFDSSDHHKWNSLKRSFRGWGRAGVKGRAATAAAILTAAAA